MGINIALDGPAGAGKSSIAKAVAKKLQFVYVDTGALYRAIALYAKRKNKDTKLEFEIKPLLSEIDVKLKFVENTQHVFLNDEDVSDEIRTQTISMAASDVSAIPCVRDFLFDLQRNIAKAENIIMDGRDIGTVVLPKADLKIFLTASPEERSKRRLIELNEKGIETTFEKVLEEIIQRDFNDSNREIAPLKQADGAILLDTSNLNLEQSIENLYKIINDNININSQVPISKETITRKRLNPLHIMFHGLIRAIVGTIYKIVYDIKFEGRENIPKSGSNIFASNHRSYADPVLLAMPTRVPFAYMAKEELFQNKLFSLLIRSFGAFPVSRGKGDSTAIDEAINKLNLGYNLVIFPEGTRSKDGVVGKGKTGVALIAAKAQATVIPVGISFEGSLKFRRKITVSYGKAISAEQLAIKSVSPTELKHLKLKIMTSITDLVVTNVNKL